MAAQPRRTWAPTKGPTAAPISEEPTFSPTAAPTPEPTPDDSFTPVHTGCFEATGFEELSDGGGAPEATVDDALARGIRTLKVTYEDVVKDKGAGLERVAKFVAAGTGWRSAFAKLLSR